MSEREQLADQLEHLVDKYGLNAMLAELANVCGEKAEHLRVNWQDSDAAKEWEKAGNRIAKACSSIELGGVS